ncbi:MAG: farnesyltranstransferase [Rickettsiales bacterium]|jgi:octaprenyl-diphosphate synthase|nr:farnesyltranstransferase [Rickettsiales bacterium]
MTASARHSTPSAPVTSVTPLIALKDLVREDLDLVNALILETGGSRVQLILDMAQHIIASGGKRLRPLLTLACARLCGYEEKKHIALAAAVEFMHTATLLHDDVVDGSMLRRGALTANNVWGNQASVLVGDFLLGQAFQLMVRSESLRVLDILSHAAAVIAEGEVKQLVASHSIDVDTETYIDIVTSKTATLFSAACEISPVLAGRPLAEQTALAEFGLNLGIAFQIADDALDYSARQEELGKGVGDDFREGKVTLPVILAYAKAGKEEKAFWERVILADSRDDEELKTAIAYIRESGALEATMEAARDYAENGRKALEMFPDSEVKTILLSSIGFAVDRPY